MEEFVENVVYNFVWASEPVSQRLKFWMSYQKERNIHFKDVYDLKALSQESQNSSGVILCAVWVLEKM